MRISKDPNRNWRNNRIQFARLIAELEAVGAFKLEISMALADEMDLSIDEVMSIVDRAQSEWDEIKALTTGVKLV